MTEADWLAARDPLVLLDELFPMRGLDSTEAQPRASKFYLIACARRVRDRMPWCANALVDVAERVLIALPQAEDPLRRAARDLAENLLRIRGEAVDLAEIDRCLRNLDIALPPCTDPDSAFEDADEWLSLAHLAYFPFAGSTPHYRRIRDDHHVLEYLHDCFPNPFHDHRLAPDWLDRNVIGVAKHIFESRAFATMPVLADALEEAGCDNPRILNHCRDAGSHIRGCWVLEGILHPPKRVLFKRA